MVTLTDAKDNGELVLEIYAHFGSRPGQVLLANNFIAVAARRHIKISDLRDSIEDAVKAGWVEDGPNGSLRLTARGFEQMSGIGVRS